MDLLKRYNPHVDNKDFAKTLAEYLGESLQPDWEDVESRQCVQRCRIMLARAPESDFAIQRAIGWLENAEYSTDPHATHIAARMVASVMPTFSDQR